MWLRFINIKNLHISNNMPTFATSNLKQDKMEMKQQKTTKAMSAMLNDIDNDILEQMRNVRSE